MLLHGPAERLDSALQAVRSAGITADPAPDRGPGVFATWFHSGDPNPSHEFITRCVERTRQAAQGTGFTVGEPGVNDSNAATRKLAYNRHTGEWLGSFVDTETPPVLLAETLAYIAETKGIVANDIELRDPPKFDSRAIDG